MFFISLEGSSVEFRCEISHKRIIKNTWLGDSDLKYRRVMLIIYGASDQILFFEFPYIKVEKSQCDHLLLWWIDALLTSVLVSFFCLFPSDIFALISHLHCPMMDVVTVNDVDLQGYKHSQTNYYIAMHVYNIIHAWDIDYDESACIHTSYFIPCDSIADSPWSWIVLLTVSGETE